MKILVCGLPGSGKTTLAKPLAKLIGAVWLNADTIRSEYDDWDFTATGRTNQATRMKYLADGIIKAGKSVVADFVAPTKESRGIFAADYVIWMDTIQKSRFDDTNQMFEPLSPKEYNYHVSEWFKDTHLQLVDVIKDFMVHGR